ncbi:MAG: type II toxin-antitoxin system RelE/ParE family toxin [Sulfurovum sp.]
MQISKLKRYKNQLTIILKHIAKDKISASEKFYNDLNELINAIPNFPFKYRKSIYFNNENIRDMTFKGYTIIYRINNKKDLIEVIRIFNKNKPTSQDRYNNGWDKWYAK